MLKTIHAELTCFNSRSDMYGNRYWSFRYKDLATDTVVEAKITGGESNISCIILEMGYKWEDVIYTRVEDMKIREYDRMIKNWPYAGCTPSDLADYIRKQIQEKSS